MPDDEICLSSSGSRMFFITLFVDAALTPDPASQQR
jgi:hypothetical protein